MAKSTKPVITPKAAPEKITFTLDLDSIAYTDKNGQEITVRAALAYFDSPSEAIGYAGSRQRTLNKDKARKASGAAASRLYVNGNLPGDAGALADQFRATMAALVPAMAPKAAAPKAAPVPALDLTSDPLEAAVAATLAAPKARKVKAAPVDPKAATAAALAAKAAPASTVTIEAPVMVPAPVLPPLQAAPVSPAVRKAAPGLDMEALRAKAAAKAAAKLAAKAATAS